MTTSTFGALMKKAEESGASFEVLEAGTYIAKIIESAAQASKNDKPQIKTRWEVIAGPKAGFKGLWNYFTLTTDNPNALAIFYRQMSTLGITSEYMASLAQLDPASAMKHIAGALEGRSAQITVEVDTEYNNNKIKRINPIPAEMAGMLSQPSQNPFAGAAAPAQPPVASVAPVEAPSAPAAPSPAPVGALPPPPFMSSPPMVSWNSWSRGYYHHTGI